MFVLCTSVRCKNAQGLLPLKLPLPLSVCPPLQELYRPAAKAVWLKGRFISSYYVVPYYTATERQYSDKKHDNLPPLQVSRSNHRHHNNCFLVLPAPTPHCCVLSVSPALYIATLTPCQSDYVRPLNNSNPTMTHTAPTQKLPLAMILRSYITPPPHRHPFIAYNTTTINISVLLYYWSCSHTLAAPRSLVYSFSSSTIFATDS